MTTRINLIGLTLLCLLTGCQLESMSHLTDSETGDPLAAGMEFWRSFAETCEGYPAKENCDDGDALLFNALLCAAGEELACTGVRQSQDNSGRFWRSPRRIGDNAGHDNSFSRDMSMGVFVYLAHTRDRSAAERWLSWIKDNKQCAVHVKTETIFGTTSNCLERAAAVCDDKEVSVRSELGQTITTTTLNNRCFITPSMWALFHYVWEHLDLPTTHSMRDNLQYDEAIVELTAVTDVGYQLHLKGVHTYLKQIMNVRANQRRELANVLMERQPANPFFRYLSEGPTAEVRERVLEVCPQPANGTNFRRHQWAWERATDSQAWLESMGWDCIFMGRLLGAN